MKTRKEVSDMLLIGADAVSLYPNLRKKETAEIVADEYLKCDLEVSGLKWKEMARYVILNSTEDEQKRWNVKQYMPVRKHKTGTRPSMTSMEGAKPVNENQWQFTEVEPGRSGEKLLLAACLRIGITVLFETHCYSFAGHDYLQSDGGPIGLRFTSCIARIRMNNWANNVQRILSECKVKVYLAKSYVDDVRWLIQAIKRGFKFEPDEELLIYDPAYEIKYENLSEYEYSSMVLCDIMNHINNDMIFTTETQCDFVDKMLPTLDFKLQLKNKCIPKLRYVFYKKNQSVQV